MNIVLSAVCVLLGVLFFSFADVRSQDNGYTPPTPVILNGDVNADGMWCMDDPVQIIYHLYRDGRELPCRNAADVDRNGSIDVNDVVLSLRFLFFGDEINECPVTCLNTEDLYKID
tara:strand:+ start:194 stop:541 length:348 start_codon:yes stop_codon:yes gene_type:complete